MPAFPSGSRLWPRPAEGAVGHCHLPPAGGKNGSWRDPGLAEKRDERGRGARGRSRGCHWGGEGVHCAGPPSPGPGRPHVDARFPHRLHEPPRNSDPSPQPEGVVLGGGGNGEGGLLPGPPFPKGSHPCPAGPKSTAAPASPRGPILFLLSSLHLEFSPSVSWAQSVK